MTKVDLALADDAAGAVSFRSPAFHRLLDALSEAAESRERDSAATAAAIGLVRKARLGAFRLPRSEGGGGASLRELFETVILLGEADSNIPHILRNQFAFTEKALRTRANPKFAGWLDEVRAGRLFGLGSSELGIQNIGTGNGETLLTPHSSDFVLNGEKYYSTGNFYADYIYVSANTPDGARVAAVIPTDREGVTVDDDWDGIGQRRTASGTTILKNVHVAKSEVVVVAEEEHRLPHEATFPQLYLTAIIAGILRAVVRDATALVKGRGRNYYHAVADRPAEDPLLQQIIGRLASVAYVAEASVLHAADALSAAYDSVAAGWTDPALFLEAALRTAKSKIIVDELALNAASQLFDVGGASAATQRHRLDRHWRNIRTISSHNPIAYKALAIGRHTIDQTPLPSAAFF